MVRPAAPWFRWGLLAWAATAVLRATSLVDVAPLARTVVDLVGVAGTVMLAVGVYRLVQHADRAAGVRPGDAPTAITARDEERAHQAAARAALAGAADTRTGGGPGNGRTPGTPA